MWKHTNHAGVVVSQTTSNSTRAARNAEADDAKLVRDARSGRQAAFDQLVERYQRRAVSIGYRLLGNSDDALDVAQDAFVRAYRSLDALEKPERFGSWFSRIVTNLALNFRRDRAARNRALSLDDMYHTDDARGDGPADPAGKHDPLDGELISAEMRGIVFAALEQLTEPQRKALVLFSLEQLPQKEVAEIMESSVEAVKWHVFQARKKLRELLADHL